MAITVTKITKIGSSRLVQASDGNTYIEDVKQMRKRSPAYSYSVMPTVVDRSRPSAENVDRRIAWGNIPLAVRKSLHQDDERTS